MQIQMDEKCKCVCVCVQYQLSEKANREHRNWQTFMEIEIEEKRACKYMCCSNTCVCVLVCLYFIRTHIHSLRHIRDVVEFYSFYISSSYFFLSFFFFIISCISLAPLCSFHSHYRTHKHCVYFFSAHVTIHSVVVLSSLTKCECIHTQSQRE